MGFIRLFAAPLVVFAVLIVFTVLGVATGGAGWVALSLLCAWPLLWGVTAWTIRSLKDSYRLVPKEAQRTQRLARNQGIPEVLG